MATLVLVHGAWHGGWCWKKVRERLQKKGHTVFTPTLTGLGERKHLNSPSVDLNTHIEDITNVLFYEDLNNVILVGHSYSGMVITGVIDAVPERIEHIIYLDAFCPSDGQSIVGMSPTEVTERRERVAKEQEDNSLPPTEGKFPWGVSEKTDLDWMEPRLTSLPIGVMYTKVRFNNPPALGIPRTFIATRGRGEEKKKKVEERGFQYREIETGHDAMITAPDELTEILWKVSDTTRNK